MAMIRAYHRPTTLQEAFDLLARPGTVPLGGGTVLNGLPIGPPEEVVDLQALDLGAITRDGATLTLGAMATLRDVVDHEATPVLLRDLARREAPNTIRNAATVGGAVAAADAESGLLAGLLASSAVVAVAQPDGTQEVALADFLSERSNPGGIITSVRVGLGGQAAFEFTARTPADIPIVLVAGTRSEEGSVVLAATGVAPTPVVFDLAHVDELDPPPDFRGSAEYRRHLATVLGGRVIARLEVAS
jgi:CO/xanthine dehydrogenase FAD-binding subunit